RPELISGAMLGDRAYMRNPSFGSQRSATVILLIINVVVFVLDTILRFWFSSFWGQAYRLLALSPDGLAHCYVWQLITYQFMHGGTLHLLFNMILVYFFGHAIEDALGRKAMVRIYLIAGVVGGLVQIIYQVGMHQIPRAHVGLGPVVGASASGLGL